jgi:hypothetical protein
MMPSASSRDWRPGLANDHQTLGEVLATLPGDPASSVPWYVRMLENPKSPVAFGGAIDLFGHDCIHVLLGRGTDQQDEAFVIGFTMGASGELTRWQELAFRWCTANLYRGVYRFSAEDQEVFDLAVSVGRSSGCRPLHTVDYRPLLHMPLGQVRPLLGIRVDMLCMAYECEYRLWPHRPTSQRLPRPSLTGHSGLAVGRVLGQAKADDGYHEKKQEKRPRKRQPLVEQSYA